MFKKVLLCLAFMLSVAVYVVADDVVRTISQDPNGYRPAVLWGNNGYAVNVDTSGNIGVDISGVVTLDTNTVISLSTITVVDSRYVLKVSSGVNGKITGVTSASIAVSGNVSRYSFRCKNEINSTPMQIDNTMEGYQCELENGYFDNEPVDIPQPITFSLSNLGVGTTIYYAIKVLN
jgi:hypothetical protein